MAAPVVCWPGRAECTVPRDVHRWEALAVVVERVTRYAESGRMAGGDQGARDGPEGQDDSYVLAEWWWYILGGTPA